MPTQLWEGLGEAFHLDMTLRLLQSSGFSRVPSGPVSGETQESRGALRKAPDPSPSSGPLSWLIFNLLSFQGSRRGPLTISGSALLTDVTLSKTVATAVPGEACSCPGERSNSVTSQLEAPGSGRGCSQPELPTRNPHVPTELAASEGVARKGRTPAVW